MDPGTLYVPCLEVIPGSRLTVTRRPANTTAITLLALVERISHTITPATWTTTFDMGPVVNVGGETYARWDSSTWNGTHVWAP
jgi:hypothetical protein